jgi:hypothetical protein
MNVRPFRSPVRIPENWQLPDDGVVDLVAVDVAARGLRPVELTETERRAAVELLLKRGGTRTLASYRLRMNYDAVCAIAAGLSPAGNSLTLKEVA